MSKTKGFLATAIFCAVLTACVAYGTYDDSCLDICISSRAGDALIGAIAGAILSTVFSGLFVGLAALGMPARSTFYALVGAAAVYGGAFALTGLIGIHFQWNSVYRLGDLFSGIFVGLSFRAGAFGWRSLLTW